MWDYSRVRLFINLYLFLWPQTSPSISRHTYIHTYIIHTAPLPSTCCSVLSEAYPLHLPQPYQTQSDGWYHYPTWRARRDRHCFCLSRRWFFIQHSLPLDTQSKKKDGAPHYISSVVRIAEQRVGTSRLSVELFYYLRLYSFF